MVKRLSLFLIGKLPLIQTPVLIIDMKKFLVIILSVLILSSCSSSEVIVVSKRSNYIVYKTKRNKIMTKEMTKDELNSIKVGDRIKL